MGKLQTGFFFESLPRFNGGGPIRFRGKGQNRFRHLFSGLKGRHPMTDTRFRNSSKFFFKPCIFFVGRPGHSLGANTDLVRQGAQSSHHLVDVRVIAIDHSQIGKRFSGYGIGFSFFPIHDFRLGNFTWRVVHQWGGYQIFHSTQMDSRQF